MNEDQIACLEAYLKLFKGTAFDKPSFYDTSGFHNLGSARAINNINSNPDLNPSVFMDFGRNHNAMYRDDDYDFNCLLQFSNINKKFIKSIFENNNYNYQVINKTIEAFYNVGKQYGLFSSMEKIADLNIDNFFKKPYQGYGKSNKLLSTETKVSEINFTDFFKTKKNMANGKLKSRRMTVFYKLVVKDGEIHPFAVIEIPVSLSEKQTIRVDIHPSGKSFNDKKLSEGLLIFDEKLKERIDMILRKELKFKNKFLNTLSFEDKLNYLKVAEMNTI